MYQTKQEFLEKLEKELTRVGVIDKTEMLADFEEHFTVSAASGMSESEVCEKLGDVSEIAKQYAESEKFPIVEAKPEEPKPEPEVKAEAHDNRTPYEKSCGNYNYSYNYTTENQPQSNPNYEGSGIKLNTGIRWGGLVAVLLVDFFVFSWAIPALFAVVLSLFSIPIALVTSGIGVIIGGAFTAGGFFTPLAIVPTIFAGVALTALGGLFVLAAIALFKLCIKIVMSIIDWHGKMIVGRPVFKNKKESKGETA